MDDTLGYSGRRCIVTGAFSGMGAATARIFVELGAEVHAVDIRKPDIPGIASFSETDLKDPSAIARTVDAIGAVVNNLFNCAALPELVDFGGLSELTERVIPNMIDGAAVTSVAYGDASSRAQIARYAANRSGDLADLGIRINCVDPGRPVGHAARPDDQAWPIVLLGSPRASYVTGATLGCES
jgi:NAD(P)-dependent dehydrogenase (short-subunit alcohol dehydrogenase family)